MTNCASLTSSLAASEFNDDKTKNNVLFDLDGAFTEKVGALPEINFDGVLAAVSDCQEALVLNMEREKTR